MTGQAPIPPHRPAGPGHAQKTLDEVLRAHALQNARFQEALARRAALARPAAPDAPPDEAPEGGGREVPEGGRPEAPAGGRPVVRAGRLPPPGFGDYRSMIGPADPAGGPRLPVAGAPAGPGPHPVTEIDSEINVLKLQLHMAELEILDHPPRDPREAILKLRFLAALLADGGQVDEGLTAALLRECADILDAAPAPA